MNYQLILLLYNLLNLQYKYIFQYLIKLKYLNHIYLKNYLLIYFSPYIQKWIISEVLYRKPGDRVRRFENSADAIGVIFLQFPNSGVMSEIMDYMREYILVETT